MTTPFFDVVRDSWDKAAKALEESSKDLDELLALIRQIDPKANTIKEVAAALKAHLDGTEIAAHELLRNLTGCATTNFTTRQALTEIARIISDRHEDHMALINGLSDAMGCRVPASTACMLPTVADWFKRNAPIRPEDSTYIRHLQTTIDKLRGELQAAKGGPRIPEFKWDLVPSFGVLSRRDQTKYYLAPTGSQLYLAPVEIDIKGFLVNPTPENLAAVAAFFDGNPNATIQRP